ncbi:MAG TPA: DUF3108 domain-containing protein [Terriglobales bacterium]|nr:DUF3108 domain-containing protein [Terriglobales bacterium]
MTTIAGLLLATMATARLQTQSPGPPAQSPVTAVPNQNSAPGGVAGSTINPPFAGYSFPTSQTFTYSVDWRLLNAGTTTVQLDTVNGERHIVANADSTGAVALLYHVHDRLETFFHSPTNCSLSLIKHTEEGFRRVETNVRYDYSRKKAVVDERNIRAKSQKHEENDVAGCVTNTVAAVYYVASQPLQPGSKLVFPSSDGGKAADIEATVEARESVKTPAGTFNTIRVSAEALNGPQKGKGRIWMWYSDDARRIPVQTRARAFWGTMTFHLTQIASRTP